MNPSIRYDEALPRFAALVEELLGAESLLDNCFLRDATGRLTFVVRIPIAEPTLSTLRARAAVLTPYVDRDGGVAAPEELFDVDLHDPGVGHLERIEHPAFTGFVRLVERRIVGQDWLQPPLGRIDGVPPIVVFASHKGGVGRSTALSVSSCALSSAGFNILVVDLDLESPGLGEILLSEPPEFGTLDYYVEAGLGDLDEKFLSAMVTSSQIRGAGLIHVVPAVGKAGNASPQNVLGKIARAYLEKTREDGTMETFLFRTRELIRRLAERARYDAIFVDARAGLNEATAAAILGLGADVLLFGVDTPQTFAGYRFFLSHLARFRPTASTEDDWRYRLRMVQAKATADPNAHAQFRTKAFEIFSDTLYDLEEGIEEEAFNFDYDDAAAPHYAWPILNDVNYAEFDPLARSDQFSEYIYDRTFGPFVRALQERMGLKR